MWVETHRCWPHQVQVSHRKPINNVQIDKTKYEWQQLHDIISNKPHVLGREGWKQDSFLTFTFPLTKLTISSLLSNTDKVWSKFCSSHSQCWFISSAVAPRKAKSSVLKLILQNKIEKKKKSNKMRYFINSLWETELSTSKFLLANKSKRSYL